MEEVRPLGRVHTFVVRRKRSPEQWQAFLAMTKGKAIPKDNKTRWNSYAIMLKTALQPPVRQAIDRWFDERAKDQPEDERITEEDWAVIEKVGIFVRNVLLIQWLITPFLQYNGFLEKLTQTTKALESNTSTLDNILPAMDYILQIFEAGKVEFKDDDVLSTCINAGWAKMDKYYNMTNDTVVYNTAVVLHPSFKWQYFQKVWEDHPSWITTAKVNVKKFWESE
jgi:hypothetical protein